MGFGKALSEAERDAIIVAFSSGLSLVAIGKKLRRSPSTVKNVVDRWVADTGFNAEKAKLADLLYEQGFTHRAVAARLGVSQHVVTRYRLGTEPTPKLAQRWRCPTCNRLYDYRQCPKCNPPVGLPCGGDESGEIEVDLSDEDEESQRRYRAIRARKIAGVDVPDGYGKYGYRPRTCITRGNGHFSTGQL